jgi:hypothetical protein
MSDPELIRTVRGSRDDAVCPRPQHRHRLHPAVAGTSRVGRLSVGYPRQRSIPADRGSRSHPAGRWIGERLVRVNAARPSWRAPLEAVAWLANLMELALKRGRRVSDGIFLTTKAVERVRPGK